MFKLKQIPEDFIVEEVPNREFDGGKYAVFLLIKKNYNTEDAVQRISDFLKVQRRNVAYAGAKDRNAVTSQFISVLGAPKQDFELKDISLKHAGETNSPISLGDLKGNKFRITVRNIQEEKINNISEFINYFDEQRFSKNNAEIGEAIIKRNYAEACRLIMEDDSKDSAAVKEMLDKNKNAYLNALKSVPRKIILIYVHAFQSKIWNELAERIVQEKIGVAAAPLPGFGTEPDEKIKKLYEEILEKNKVSSRDFILRDFPEISLEGSEREIKVQVHDLKIGNLEEDELNPGMKKAAVEFFLGKGSYATMAVKNMMR
ncbi:MAG: tRNA pseudouridine(13) synthase TruD [Candidatus Nanoarchaeia archaeon]